MSRRFSNLRPGMLLVALVIAVILWGIAHGSSSKERAFDVPVELHGLSDELVVTDRDPDEINVRVMGSISALRHVDGKALRYLVDVSGSKPGDAEFEVDVARVEQDLPRGARVVSRSPSRILLRFEPRGRKAVGVRVDLEGEPPKGFVLGEVEVEPARVWITGARSQVLRLSEVVTEPVELASLKETSEREVSLFLGAGTVWLEKKEPVKIVIHIEPEPVPELEPLDPLEPVGDEGALEETEPS